MITLLRSLRHWLHEFGWRRAAIIKTGRDLARDLELPTEIVSKVLDQAAEDLRNIGSKGEASGAFMIINRAVSELAKHGFHARPLDEAALNRYLQQVPEPHFTILRHYRAGMKHTEIAALLHMDKQSVLRSLARTYADLRMKMIGGRNGGGLQSHGTTRKPAHAISRH